MFWVGVETTGTDGVCRALCLYALGERVTGIATLAESYVAALGIWVRFGTTSGTVCELPKVIFGVWRCVCLAGRFNLDRSISLTPRL
jgi:hypothetical protein